MTMTTTLQPVVPRNESAVFVHPLALCDTDQVGEGTRIWPFAHVMDGAVVGKQCNIGEHVFIENGVRVGDRVTIKNYTGLWQGATIEDDVFVGAGVIFSNDRFPRARNSSPEVVERYRDQSQWLLPTTVRQGASIGCGVMFLPGVTIGRYALVGIGAVVSRDVVDHRVVIGNPARRIGWACFCGTTLNEQLQCPRCERVYKKHGESILEAG